MTSVSGNLPDGMKPHESDPKPQSVWTGQVHGSVVVHDTVLIGKHSHCANQNEAIKRARRLLLEIARAQNPYLDCEACDDFKAEPDRGDDDT